MIVRVALVFISFAGALTWAQEPPDVTPGYATEGRPGFVTIETAQQVMDLTRRGVR